MISCATRQRENMLLKKWEWVGKKSNLIMKGARSNIENGDRK